MGDSFGEKTCYTHNGSSTVDYFILSDPLLSKIEYLKVRPQTWFSDHSPLELSLRLDIRPTTNVQIPLKKLTSYIWDDEGKEKFQTLMSDNNSIEALQNVPKLDTIDKCVNSITDFLHDCASKCLKPKSKTESQRRYPSCTTDKPELQRAKSVFNRSWKNLRLYRNKDRHVEFIKARSRYKRLKYLYYNYNKEDKLYKSANIESKDPKSLWRTIKDAFYSFCGAVLYVRLWLCDTYTLRKKILF